MTTHGSPPDSLPEGPPEPWGGDAELADIRRLEVRLPARSERAYSFVVGAGAWAPLPKLLAGEVGGIALVSEERVFGLYGERLLARVASLGRPVRHYLFPPGEASKTRAVKAELEDRLLADRWGRDVVIVALGGGVVTDLAGFLAATYLRGVRYLSLPTTLLAMVDAAIGGKTGVNTDAGKNLVGAFHQPEAVLADVECLRSLPPSEWQTGLAETVKHAMIGDASLLDSLVEQASVLREAPPEVLSELVARSAAVKVRVVSADELEAGLRQILNFGHTVGHAIEQASGYRISHGQAVSMGMLVEADAAVAAGLLASAVRDRLEQALGALGLARSLPPGVPCDGVLAALGADKKARGGEVRYALPEAVGRAADFEGRYVVALPVEAVRAALEARS